MNQHQQSRHQQGCAVNAIKQLLSRTQSALKQIAAVLPDTGPEPRKKKSALISKVCCLPSKSGLRLDFTAVSAHISKFFIMQGICKWAGGENGG